MTLALNVGSVPVRFEGEGLFGQMTQPEPEFGEELDKAEVARLTGLAVEDLDPALPPRWSPRERPSRLFRCALPRRWRGSK